MLRFLAAASLAAAQICPESHPHECSAPTTDSYGPCCDLSADCQCKPAEWIHDEELDGGLGAAYLPRTQPIGDPDASCAVGPPRRVGSYGVNWGGCFTCTTTGDTRGELLNSTDLAEACLARCLGDPLCRGFEVAAPPLNAYQKAVSSERNVEANCCIEHHAPDDPAVAQVVVTHDGAKADLCKGEAACWTSYELSGTCDAQPAWAASAALRCYSSEENCGQAGALRGPIEDWAEIVNEEGCNGGIARFFHHCVEDGRRKGRRRAPSTRAACGATAAASSTGPPPARRPTHSPTARCALTLSPRRRPPSPSVAARRGMGWTDASTRRARNTSASTWSRTGARSTSMAT